jgi:hypothetical protein
MEIHRSYRGDRKLALVGIGYGLVAFIVGSVLALVDVRSVALSLGVWLSGGFFFLVGLYLFLMTLRPFRIQVSESGLIVHCEGHHFEGPWHLVESISIERVPVTTEERYVLVLCVADGVPMKHAPSFPPSGSRRGHVLVGLDNLRESREEISAILATYAGPRFRTTALT